MKPNFLFLSLIVVGHLGIYKFISNVHPDTNFISPFCPLLFSLDP